MSFGSRFLDPPNALERERMDACRRSGCVACHQLGLPLSEHCGVMEYNHRKAGGVTTGHRWGYSLGRWHHQGFAKHGYQLDYMLFKYGPNLRDDKGGFHARFGADQALQNDQDDRIGVPRQDMPSRRELRAAGGQVKRKPSRCTASSKTVPRSFRP